MRGYIIETVRRLYLPDSFVLRIRGGFYLYRDGVWGKRKWGRDIRCAQEFFSLEDAKASVARLVSKCRKKGKTNGNI